MPIKHIAAAPRKARKGKAGEAKVRSYKKGGRTGKQFGGGINQPLAGGVNQPLGGGINQPLGGGRMPVRPVGFKHGKRAKKK